MIIDIRRIEEIVANNRKSVKTESLDMKFDGTYFIPTTSSDNNKITVPMKYGDDELAGYMQLLAGEILIPSSLSKTTLSPIK